MEQYIDRYVDYLRNVKKSSENTVASYRRDLIKFYRYFDEKGITRMKARLQLIFSAMMPRRQQIF